MHSEMSDEPIVAMKVKPQYQWILKNLNKIHSKTWQSGTLKLSTGMSHSTISNGIKILKKSENLNL
jgi:hypothetical protein